MVFKNNRIILNLFMLFSIATPVSSPAMAPNAPQERAPLEPSVTLHTLQDIALYLALGAVLTYVAMRIYKSVQKSSKKKNPNPSAPILITTQRIPALSQKDATCGYHALKNAIALGDEHHRSLLTDQNFTQLHIDTGGIWRQIIIELAKQRNNQLQSNDPNILYDATGVNLDEHGIYALREETLSLLPTDAHFIVLSDVHAIRQEQRDALRHHGIHRIVLRVNNGHWIAVVIKRDARKVVYEWADSLNHEHYPEITVLQKTLESIKKP